MKKFTGLSVLNVNGQLRRCHVRGHAFLCIRTQTANGTKRSFYTQPCKSEIVHGFLVGGLIYAYVLGLEFMMASII